MINNKKNNRKSPVGKRLGRLTESTGEPVMKLFKELKKGEMFSTSKNGKVIPYNGEISGVYSIDSPTRMCYFMSGYKTETRVDGEKDDLLNMPVYSYGFPEGYAEPSADDVHDERLVDLAKSTTYRDSIMDYAVRCRKASNRKLILSLLDDPDVILEEGLESVHNDSEKVNEGYEMSEGYPVMGKAEIDDLYKFIMADKWIETMALHYIDVRDERKDDDHKEMVPLVIKDICRHYELNPDQIKVIFGYYMLVIDIDMAFAGGDVMTPAYIHIVRDVESGKWSMKVFRRGH